MKKIKELCGIDIRSLALFRIGLALMLLGDLITRARDLQAHYTDDGVLPRDLLNSGILEHWIISFHSISGLWEVQLILFILAGLFAFALLIGYYTRIASILSWIFLISLQARNPLVLQGGDTVLRLLAFWAIFLPLEGCWSLDSLLDREPKRSPQVVSVATLGLLLQVCFIYWFTALLKSHPIWTTDGTAVWYALSNEFFSKPLGIYLLNFPGLLKVLSFGTYYLECYGPFIAFSPICTGPLRLATALVFILFHLVGLNLTMELGIFPYVCVVAWLVFIPGWFWDRVLAKPEISDSSWATTPTSNGLAAFFIVYIFLWNVQTLNIHVPGFSYRIGFLFGVGQLWDMFAPYPLKDDGWYVVPATLKNGEKVDLYAGGPLKWGKPALVSATYKDDRWRSYFLSLFLKKKNQVALSGYAAYLSRKWNETHPEDEQIKELEIVFMTKINNIEDPNTLPRRQVLWQRN